MKNLILVTLVCALSACSSAPKTTAQSGFQLRSYQEETLPNGLRLIFIPDQSLPRVSFQMMVMTGGLYEPKNQGGVAALTFGLLDKGTKTRNALTLADDFAEIGSEFNATAGADLSFISASGISPNRNTLLKLYSDVVMNPAFQNAEIRRLKSQYMAAIEKAMDQPQTYADQLFDEALFADHPYGRPRFGTKASLTKITRADIVRFYQSWVQPKNAILAVVGQIDDGFKQKVRDSFSAWKAEAALPAEPVRPGVADAPGRKLVSKRDLQQVQVRMGHQGIRRNDPDFLRLRMASLILGGAFASRLNQKIRDDLGLTYSINSNSEARLDRGSFEISTFTRNEKAAETIRETEKVLREFVEKGATQKEVDAAKALLIGQFPSALETPDRLAYNLLILRRYGIGDDYLQDFHGRVNAITLEEVNETARRHLHPDQVKVLVYADQAKVGESLKSLGEWKLEAL